MFVTSNKSQSAPIPALSQQLDHDFSDLNFIPVFIDLADENVHGSTDPIDYNDKEENEYNIFK